VIGRRDHHLPDDRLVERYVAEHTGETIEAAIASHLDGCEECATRYASLALFMDDLRSEAEMDVDALYPDEQLQASRRQIARRLENLGHIARVISFPGRRAEARRVHAPAHQRSRWIAGAAAAGLLVGVALGAYTVTVADDRSAYVEVSPPAVTATPENSAVQTDRPVTVLDPVLDEDAFLEELEIAGGGLRASPLMPLDAFTPTVREVSAQLR
jgi:hypothetical protein